jgi:hypothetical protein
MMRKALEAKVVINSFELSGEQSEALRAACITFMEHLGSREVQEVLGVRAVNYSIRMEEIINLMDRAEV